MAISAFSGPVIAWGQNPILPDYNPDLGSSMFFAGAGILDPRTPFTYLTGESQSQVDYAWLGFDHIKTWIGVPYTSATGVVVASANPTSATLVIASANSATTGVYITSNFIRSDTGALDAGPLVAIDAYASTTASCTAGVLTVTANSSMPIGPGMVLLSSSTTVTGTALGPASGVYILSQLTTTGTSSSAGNGYNGTYQLSQPVTWLSGTVTLAYPNVQSCFVQNPVGNQPPSTALWNPMAMTARTLGAFAATSATYTTATISGYDVYGYPMVEAITLSANAVVAGKKAWKYVKSVVLSGGSADTTHAYRVDTLSIFGLPMRADTSEEVSVNAGASQVALTGNTAFAANGFLPADRTTPSATTGDVRGTIDVSNASGVNLVPSTATNKFTFKQNIAPYNVQTATGLFGLTQFANF